jgi:hypothetical protein
MNNQLELMRKRIEHTRKKQTEDYERELNLRLAKKGIKRPAANSSTLGN